MAGAIILKRPVVRFDLVAHYAHIRERNPDAAARFLANAEATFASLARSPHIGATYPLDNPRLAGVRCCSIRRLKKTIWSSTCRSRMEST